jgi:hypothetical protein
MNSFEFQFTLIYVFFENFWVRTKGNFVCVNEREGKTKNTGGGNRA